MLIKLKQQKTELRASEVPSCAGDIRVFGGGQRSDAQHHHPAALPGGHPLRDCPPGQRIACAAALRTGKVASKQERSKQVGQYVSVVQHVHVTEGLACDQAARVVAMDRERLRSGDSACLASAVVV